MSYKPKCKTRNNWPHGGAIDPILEYVKHLHMGHLSMKFEHFSTFNFWDMSFQTLLPLTFHYKF